MGKRERWPRRYTGLKRTTAAMVIRDLSTTATCFSAFLLVPSRKLESFAFMWGLFSLGLVQNTINQTRRA